MKQSYGIVINSPEQAARAAAEIGRLPVPMKHGWHISIAPYNPKQTRSQRCLLEVTFRNAAHEAGCVSDNEVMQLREALLAQLQGGEQVEVGGVKVWRRRTTKNLSRAEMSSLLERAIVMLANAGF